ncbi:MAG: hypothetical protein OXD01_12790 [Gammaproteobacteria bacterium]|nr:hypothetical protein [Gammaproteobacteria bacterium]
MAFGQQGRVANDVASGFQIGSAIGGGIRQKRDERRRQREVDRILSKIQLGTSVDDLPDPKLVKALGQVAGPEFANQWLEVSTQLKGMGDAKRAQAQEDLRSQSQFEMSVFESLLKVPEEERANFYSEMMTRYVKNPDSQEMALNSMQSFLGPAMKGDMPDFSDGKLNAYLTQQRYFLDGIKIMQDTRDMTARQKEIAEEAAQARATMAQQQGFESDQARDQRAFDADQANQQRTFEGDQANQQRTFEGDQAALERESDADMQRRQIAAEAANSAANRNAELTESERQRNFESRQNQADRENAIEIEKIKAAARGEASNLSSGNIVEQAEMLAKKYNGSVMAFYTLLSDREMIPMAEGNKIVGYQGPDGKALDFGSFNVKNYRQLSADDPLASGGSPTTTRRTDINSWLNK